MKLNAWSTLLIMFVSIGALSTLIAFTTSVDPIPFQKLWMHAAGISITSVGLVRVMAWWQVVAAPQPTAFIWTGRKCHCTHPDIHDKVIVVDPFCGPWVIVRYKQTYYFCYPRELYAI